MATNFFPLRRTDAAVRPSVRWDDLSRTYRGSQPSIDTLCVCVRGWAIVMTVLPATIAYLTFQRYFVSGLTSGAIKE